MDTDSSESRLVAGASHSLPWLHNGDGHMTGYNRPQCLARGTVAVIQLIKLWPFISSFVYAVCLLSGAEDQACLAIGSQNDYRGERVRSTSTSILALYK